MTTQGEIIKWLYKERGFMQGQFADLAKIDRTLFNRIVNGGKPLGKILQKRIAQGLRLPLAVFLFFINLEAPLEIHKILLEIVDLNDAEGLAIIGEILSFLKKTRGEKQPAELRRSVFSQIGNALEMAALIAKKGED
jgi:transcriptional regulator with XRE-family HTH domain